MLYKAPLYYFNGLNDFDILYTLNMKLYNYEIDLLLYSNNNSILLINYVLF